MPGRAGAELAEAGRRAGTSSTCRCSTSGAAQLLLLPGEAYVEYQLLAQKTAARLVRADAGLRRVRDRLRPDREGRRGERRQPGRLVLGAGGGEGVDGRDPQGAGGRAGPATSCVGQAALCLSRHLRRQRQSSALCPTPKGDPAACVGQSSALPVAPPAAEAKQCFAPHPRQTGQTGREARRREPPWPAAGAQTAGLAHVAANSASRPCRISSRRSSWVAVRTPGDDFLASSSSLTSFGQWPPSTSSRSCRNWLTASDSVAREAITSAVTSCFRSRPATRWRSRSSMNLAASGLFDEGLEDLTQVVGEQRRAAQPGHQHQADEQHRAEKTRGRRTRAAERSWEGDLGSPRRHAVAPGRPGGPLCRPARRGGSRSAEKEDSSAREGRGQDLCMGGVMSQGRRRPWWVGSAAGGPAPGVGKSGDAHVTSSRLNVRER